jgi:CHAD domain-containing protein
VARRDDSARAERSRRSQSPPLSPDDDAGAAARRVLAVWLGAFDHEVSGACEGDVEAIHQLRVAMRRLRATLALFEPVLPAGVVASLTEDLAWLGRGVGGVRDLDVLAIAIGALERSLDDDARAALGGLEHALAERRAVALVEMGRLLDMPRTQRLRVRLGQLARPRARVHPAARLGDVAGDLLRPLLTAARRAGRDLDPDTPPVAFHRLRVRVKRLRYGCETLDSLAPKAIRPLVARLVRLQDALGEHQDAMTHAAWLRATAASAQLRPATLLAMGALVDRLERRAAKRRARMGGLWERFDRRRPRERLLESLRGLGSRPTGRTEG